MVAQVPELFETLTGMKVSELMSRLQGHPVGPPLPRQRENGSTSLRGALKHADSLARAVFAPAEARAPTARRAHASDDAAARSPSAACWCFRVPPGLIYQVAWVRLLGLAFGVTVFAISTVLAAFMGGLAIGSIVGGRRADLVADRCACMAWSRSASA